MPVHRQIEIGVVPAAGMGTRLRPLTGYMAKEMLPVFDAPAIELVVREAAEAGLRRLVIVISPQKRDIVSYLRGRGFVSAASGRRLEIIEAIQERPMGLGHAVLCAASETGGSPFAVLLPDALVFSDQPQIARLINIWPGKGVCISLRRTTPDELSQSGAAVVERSSGGVCRVKQLVEKPPMSSVTSDLMVVGRYVLPPEVHAMLTAVERSSGGELQLTDAINAICGTDGVLGLEVKGDYFDAGSFAGLLAASVHRAVNDSGTSAGAAEALRTHLAEILVRRRDSASGI